MCTKCHESPIRSCFNLAPDSLDLIPHRKREPECRTPAKEKKNSNNFNSRIESYRKAQVIKIKKKELARGRHEKYLEGLESYATGNNNLA